MTTLIAFIYAETPALVLSWLLVSNGYYIEFGIMCVYVIATIGVHQYKGKQK